MLFEAKYGVSSRQVIEADELNLENFNKRFDQALLDLDLFSSAKLIIVKRITAQENSSKTPFSKSFVEIVKKRIENLDENITLVVWEEQSLSLKHPLREAFEDWQVKGLAKINRYDLPNLRNLSVLAKKYLQERGIEIAPEAMNWLEQQYLLQEKNLRILAKLKYDQELMKDERSWWLEHILEEACLAQVGGRIEIKDLESISNSNTALQTVQVFDVVKALFSTNWSLARKMFKQWEDAEVDLDSHFGLLGAIRWQLSKGDGRLSSTQKIQLEHLILDLEIILKNYPVSVYWLWEMIILRLEINDQNKNILPIKMLWLASLAR